MRFALRTRKQRIFAVAASGSVLALVATGAVAYYTQVSATSTAQTAQSSSVVISNVMSPSGLTPGGPAKPIAVTLRNDNAEVVHVGTIHVAIGTFSNPQPDTTLPPCTAGDFTLSPDVAVNVDFSYGETQTYKPTIAMNNNPLTNQDNCRGQNIPLTVTVS